MTRTFNILGLLCLLLLGAIGGAGAGTIVCAPSVITPSHSGLLTLTLTGTGTAWTGGTTFTVTNSVSGTTAVALNSQTVTTPTSASLVISTGTGTGTYSISDGASTVTGIVGNAFLSATTNAVFATTTATVSFYEYGAVWLQDTPALTVSSVTGATLTAQSATSNTTMTATLSLPANATGNLTIIDPKTGVTCQTVTVFPNRTTPAWTLTLDDQGKQADQVTNRSNSTASAGSFTDIGNGWVDTVGQWQMNSGVINSASSAKGLLARQSTERYKNVKIVVYCLSNVSLMTFSNRGQSWSFSPGAGAPGYYNGRLNTGDSFGSPHYTWGFLAPSNTIASIRAEMSVWQVDATTMHVRSQIFDQSSPSVALSTNEYEINGDAVANNSMVGLNAYNWGASRVQIYTGAPVAPALYADASKIDRPPFCPNVRQMNSTITAPSVGASVTYKQNYVAFRAGGNLRLAFEDAGVFPYGITNQLVPITLNAVLVAGGITYPVTFNGTNNRTVAVNDLAVSDPVLVHIAASGSFSVIVNVSGSVYPLTTGSVSSNYATGGGDATAGGSLAGDTQGFLPCAIIGTYDYPTVSTVFIVGDSIAAGQADSGGTGYIEDALITAGIPFLNTAVAGDAAGSWTLASRLPRNILAQSCRNIIIEYGHNDLAQGQSAAALEASITSILSDYYVSKLRTFACTLTPSTTSTDAWLTTTNQSLATNAQIWGAGGTNQLYNDWLRTAAPLTSHVGSVFDVADMTMNGRNTGLFPTSASAYTPDGIHLSHTGALAAGASIDTTQFDATPIVPVFTALFASSGQIKRGR